MNRIGSILLVAGFIYCILSLPVIADVPFLINYRGYIDVADPGIGLATGAISVELEFALYDSAEIEEATPLWTESQTVQLLDGNFAVMLGNVNPLSLDLFSSSQRYLTVSAGGSIIAGPQRILSAPYAMQAGNVYSAPNGKVGIGTTNPSAKLEVDGNIRSSGKVLTGSDVIASGGITAESVTSNGLIYSTSGGIKFPDGTTLTTVPTVSGYSLDAADGNPKNVVYVDNGGKVGIGTQTPSKKFQVAGEAIVDSTLTVAGALVGQLASHGWKIQTLPTAWNGLGMPYGGLGIGMEGNQDGAFGRMLIFSVGSDAHADNWPTLMYAQRNYGGDWETPLVIRRDGKIVVSGDITFEGEVTGAGFPSADHDSGWFAVSANNTYTVNHALNLSDLPTNIQMFVSNVQSPVLGTDQIYLLNQAPILLF